MASIHRFAKQLMEMIHPISHSFFGRNNIAVSKRNLEKILREQTIKAVFIYGNVADNDCEHVS